MKFVLLSYTALRARSRTFKAIARSTSYGEEYVSIPLPLKMDGRNDDATA